MARNTNDMAKAVVFSIQAVNLTAEVLADMLKNYTEKKSDFKTGKTSLGELRKQSNGKLYSETISDSNIGAFRDIANKYDLTYSLKSDKSTDPPTWLVFISSDTRQKEVYERAFAEFADKILSPAHESRKRGLDPNQLHLVETPQKKQQAEQTAPDLWAGFPDIEERQ